jgi:hypothetical protein
MRRQGIALLTGAALLLALAPAVLAAENFATELSGANQVPPVEVAATGDATVTISDDEQTVSWDVSYSGLTGAPAAGHIHIGAEGENGPVMIPFAEVTETGTTGSFAAADYTGGDGLPADWAGVLAAIRDGNAYVNIHTEANPSGEIRGQLAPAGGGGGATTPPTDTLERGQGGAGTTPLALLAVLGTMAVIGAFVRVLAVRRR